MLSAVIAVFALIPVRIQVGDLGYEYINSGEQLSRHQHLIVGTAGNPWQYRLLPDFLLYPAIAAARMISPSQGPFIVFVSLRVLLNIGIFAAAYAYYRRLECSPYASLIGLWLISWGMCFSNHDADLSFSAYLDILVYLCALLLILGRFSAALFLVLCAIGALNRETSGFLPIILAVSTLWRIPGAAAGKERSSRLWTASGGALLWVCIFCLLRCAYDAPLTYAYGHRPFTWSMVNFNVGRMVTWRMVFRTINVTPFLALVLFRYWPPGLKVMFLLLVPAWVLVHLAGSVFAETRHLLVPFILAFVPATTGGLERWARETNRRVIGAIFISAALVGWHFACGACSRGMRFDYVVAAAAGFCLFWGSVLSVFHEGRTPSLG